MEGLDQFAESRVARFLISQKNIFMALYLSLTFIPKVGAWSRLNFCPPLSCEAVVIDVNAFVWVVERNYDGLQHDEKHAHSILKEKCYLSQIETWLADLDCSLCLQLSFV